MGDDERDDRRALRRRCLDRGYTPAAADTDAIVALWRAAPEDRPLRNAIGRVLRRGDAGVARRLTAGFDEASDAERALRLRALGTIARRFSLDGWSQRLAAALSDPAPRVLREAARAVGQSPHVDDARHEAVLLARVDLAELPQRRVIVDALGRIGGPAAAAYLTAATTDDVDLQRRIGRARTLVERRATRADAGTIAPDVPLPASAWVRLRCRAGASSVVLAQAKAALGEAGAQATVDTPSAVALPWHGTLRDLHAARTAADVALPFPLAPGDDLAGRIVATLQRADLLAAVQAWSEGTPTFRLKFVRQGHRRAVAWNVAEALSQSDSPLHNDSRAAAWTFEVDVAARSLRCVPRHGDGRFAYRHADVPAASHPTLAATLAWHGSPKSGERVWDPFCGSGSELVECAVLSAGLHLVGTDVDPAAIAAATDNFAAAQRPVASARFVHSDARSADPGGPVSLVVSNPPMGTRVAHDGDVKQLLADAIANVASHLAPDGRWVWITASPKWTAEVAQRCGLAVASLHDFDMGGFTATVQRLHRKT